MQVNLKLHPKYNCQSPLESERSSRPGHVHLAVAGSESSHVPWSQSLSINSHIHCVLVRKYALGVWHPNLIVLFCFVFLPMAAFYSFLVPFRNLIGNLICSIAHYSFWNRWKWALNVSVQKVCFLRIGSWHQAGNAYMKRKETVYSNKISKTQFHH